MAAVTSYENTPLYFLFSFSQVVYYQRSGHYHAHYDSSVGENVEKKRCCQRNEDRDTTSCLLCR